MFYFESLSLSRWALLLGNMPVCSNYFYFHEMGLLRKSRPQKFSLCTRVNVVRLEHVHVKYVTSFYVHIKTFKNCNIQVYFIQRKATRSITLQSLVLRSKIAENQCKNTIIKVQNTFQVQRG